MTFVLEVITPMTSFHYNIGSRAQRAGRFIARVRSELLRVLSEKKSRNGLTQQALAERLGVDRSQINRQLSGESNLTLRTLADLAWAMDMELSFELREQRACFGQNDGVHTSTICHGPIKVVQLDDSVGRALAGKQQASQMPAAQE